MEAALIAGMVAPGLISADASKRRNERDGVGTEFVDDGSGSFVPNQQTSYAFERWPDHDRALLDEALSEAEAIGADARKALRVAPTLIGNYAHGGALSLARRAAVAAGVDGMISFTQGDCGDLTHPALASAREAELEYFEKLEAEAAENFRENQKYGDGFVDLEKLGPVTARPVGGGVLVVSNPPWGKRLDVGGERDAEGQRRSAKRWGSDGYRCADFGGEDDDDFFVDDVDDEIASEDADETTSAWHSLGAFSGASARARPRTCSPATPTRRVR